MMLWEGERERGVLVPHNSHFAGFPSCKKATFDDDDMLHFHACHHESAASTIAGHDVVQCISD